MTALIAPASPAVVQAAGWSVSVDGAMLPSVGHVVIQNSKFGILSFGLRPEQTIGWGWREVGGVGIIPWVVFEGKLLIGLLQQDRPFIGKDPILNIPRGFAKLAATFEESAAAEFKEEVGLRGDEWPRRLVSLGDVATNANSTFFDTTDKRGFRYFAFEAKESELEEQDGMLRFKRELVLRTDDPAEWIRDCVFVQWYKAAKNPDNFSSAGVARLIASKRELIAYL